MTTADFKIKPPEYLSPSSISTFQQCPLKFKFSRIDGIKEPPTRATLLGNFVHDVLEGMYGLTPKDRTKESARRIAGEIFTSKDWAGQIMPYIGGDQGILKFKQDAWRCVDNLWIIEEPSETDATGLEHRIEGELFGVKMKGFIDRFTRAEDGTVTISDYKTGKAPNPKFADQKFFQLQIYAALIAATGEGEPTQLELLFLEAAAKFTKAVDEDVIEETAVKVRGVMDAVEASCIAGHFEPQTSKLCDWCFFKADCPAFAKN